jgi:hypothetical protein
MDQFQAWLFRALQQAEPGLGGMELDFAPLGFAGYLANYLGFSWEL